MNNVGVFDWEWGAIYYYSRNSCLFIVLLLPLQAPLTFPSFKISPHSNLVFFPTSLSFYKNLRIHLCSFVVSQIVELAFEF